MKNTCMNCENKYETTFLKFVNSLLSENFCLCDTCIKLKTWEENSKYIRYDGISNELYIKEFENPSDIIDDVIRFNLNVAKLDIGERNKILKIRKRDLNESERIWPEEIKNNYLIGYNVEYDPNIENGMFRKGKILKEIPLSCISYIKIESDIEKYEEPDVNEPIIGYKGLRLDKGILFANNDYIFDINVPYIESKKNPYKYDYQDIYSHFCQSIEDVIAWRNFLLHPNYRVFKVKAEGHCRKYGGHWVSNKLTIISEVTQDEIIEYFNSDPEKLKIVKGMPDKVWDKYLETKRKPYKVIVDEKEILDLYVHGCDGYKSRICKQCDSILSYKLCDECSLKGIIVEANKGKLYYLQLRAEILNKSFRENDERLKWLIEHKQKNKVQALRRLLKYTE